MDQPAGRLNRITPGLRSPTDLGLGLEAFGERLQRKENDPEANEKECKTASHTSFTIVLAVLCRKGRTHA
jgi:hypothetical protein